MDEEIKIGHLSRIVESLDIGEKMSRIDKNDHNLNSILIDMISTQTSGNKNSINFYNFSIILGKLQFISG